MKKLEELLLKQTEEAKKPPPPKEEPFEIKYIESIAMLMSVSNLPKDVVVGVLKNFDGDADLAMGRLLELMPKPIEQPKKVSIMIDGLKVVALRTL